MPLRGSLFRKLQKFKKQRQKAESVRFKKEAVRERKELKTLKTKRIQVEGKAALERAISMEKSRIQTAKKAKPKGFVSRFLEKEARKVKKAAVKQIKKKRIKVTFG